MLKKLKITSFAGLCEELGSRRDRVFEVACRMGYFHDWDREGFDHALPAPVDLAWWWSYRTGRITMNSSELKDYQEWPADLYRTDLENVRRRFWLTREHWRERSTDKEIPSEVEGFLADNDLSRYLIRVSEEDPTMWVYTPDEEYALADRQIRMRPGKMLKKLLPEMPDATIQRVATAFTQGTATNEVQWARTAEEIEHVYVEGPHSCMAYSTDGDFKGLRGHHPTAAYAGPDTAVAYLSDLSGHITARTVVNTGEKRFGRCYGNEIALQKALESAGYRKVGQPLLNCRLKYISLGDGNILCPYIDGISRGYVEGGYLVLGDSGPIDVQTANGYTEEESGCECVECSDRVEEKDMTYVSDFGDVCERCLDRNFSHAVVGGSARSYDYEYVRNSDATFIEAIGEYVEDNFLHSHADRIGLAYSDYDAEWCKEEHVVFVQSREESASTELNEIVYIEGRDEYAFVEDCALVKGAWYRRTDVVEVDGQWCLKKDVVEVEGGWRLRETGADARLRDNATIPLPLPEPVVTPLVTEIETEEVTA